MSNKNIVILRLKKFISTLKLYYSISEAAEMLGIPQSKLRFWEKEFPQLKPKRTTGDTRQYSEKDIETVKQIMLLKKQNLKLEGAKRKLSDKPELVEKQQQILETLQEIKADLEGVLKFLVVSD
jgi:DNA-binding transcriptional MerR regulator